MLQQLTPVLLQHELLGCGCGVQGDDAALAQSVQRMAQLALLGLGSAAGMFPNAQNLDELYAASAEEQVSRIML